MSVRGWIVSVVSVLAIVALSRVPIGGGSEDLGLLRLSWRTTGETTDDCPVLTGEQLARLPPEQRAAAASCRPRVAPYELQVRLDEHTVLVDTAHASGIRGDRPIYVLHDLPVSPQEHRVSVRFAPILDGAPDPAAESAATFEERVRVGRGEVVLLTSDEDGRGLVLRRGGR